MEKQKEEKKLCAYCQKAEAKGFVSSYKAWICESCYEDHHGSLEY